MDDVTVVLRLLVEFHVRIVAVPAQIVASQIDQHHVFCIFFRISQQSFGQGFIGFLVSASASSTGNRVDGRFSIFNFAVSLGRRTENTESTEIKVEQVRRRIDASQGTVEGEVIAFVALDETTGKYNLEYISSFTVSDTFTDVGFVLFIGQGAGSFTDYPEVVGRIVPVLDCLFNFLDVARFVVSLQFHQDHFALEVVEYNQVFVEDVQNIRCIVFRVTAVFHRNRFKITDRIEGGVTIDTGVAGIFSFYLEMFQKILESIFHLEVRRQRTFFAAFVREDGSDYSVVY